MLVHSIAWPSLTRFTHFLSTHMHSSAADPMRDGAPSGEATGCCCSDDERSSHARSFQAGPCYLAYGQHRRRCATLMCQPGFVEPRRSRSSCESRRSGQFRPSIVEGSALRMTEETAVWPPPRQLRTKLSLDAAPLLAGVFSSHSARCEARRAVRHRFLLQLIAL